MNLCTQVKWDPTAWWSIIRIKIIINMIKLASLCRTGLKGFTWTSNWQHDLGQLSRLNVTLRVWFAWKPVWPTFNKQHSKNDVLVLWRFRCLIHQIKFCYMFMFSFVFLEVHMHEPRNAKSGAYIWYRHQPKTYICKFILNFFCNKWYMIQ